MVRTGNAQLDEAVVNVLGRIACFAAGTLIHTETGLKPIEDIKIGDRVWSRSEHDTGEPTWRTVLEAGCTDSAAEIWEIGVSTPKGQSETYRCTKMHPFWSETGGDDGKGGFIAAGWLDVGEQLRLHDGTPAYVTSVTKTEMIEPVFNIAVDGFKTYHVGQLGVWVHNTCPLKLENFIKGLELEAPRKLEVNDWKKGGLLYRKGIQNTGSRAPDFREWLKKGNEVIFHPDGAVEYIAKTGFKKGKHEPLTEDISVTYRRNVDTGYYDPDFTPFAKEYNGRKSVTIDMAFDTSVDYERTLKAFEIKTTNTSNWLTEEFVTPHHHQDMKTMSLLDQRLHDIFTHIGARGLNNKQNKPG